MTTTAATNLIFVVFIFLCNPRPKLISACVFQIRWFDDPVSRCMQHVDAIETKDLTQKCEFFTKLAQTIPQFPRVSSNKELANYQS